MTIQQRQVWEDGKDLWFEYIRVNGYAFNPSDKGIKELSRLLDLNQKYIKERINFYLEN
jgi:hypothetical protein